MFGTISRDLEAVERHATGKADPEHGIREFIVGTGGASFRPVLLPRPNSEARAMFVWGVLKLTLHPTSYDWAFIPVEGQTFTDSGSGDCHPKPGLKTS